MTKAELIDFVKSYAVVNYEKDGWDYVVECWDAEQIAETIGNASTPRGALKKMRERIKPLADYRDEIQSTAW